MIGCLFIQADAQELPQPQRIGTPPGDATFGIDSLEVSNQQKPKVGTGGQGRAAIVIRVEFRALSLAEFVELLAIKQFVQAPIEGMAGSRGQFGMGSPRAVPGVADACECPWTWKHFKARMSFTPEPFATLTTDC